MCISLILCILWERSFIIKTFIKQPLGFGALLKPLIGLSLKMVPQSGLFKMVFQ